MWRPLLDDRRLAWAPEAVVGERRGASESSGGEVGMTPPADERRSNAGVPPTALSDKAFATVENATRALAGADLAGGAVTAFRPSDVGESAPVTSRHVVEMAGHRVAHRRAVGQRRRLASIPTTDRQQQRPHGVASRGRDDKGPELVRAAIDNQRAVADSFGQRECRSALEPLGRARDASRQNLFLHLGPCGDRVRSHPEPKSGERRALALCDDGLKTALLACTVERRDAVHSCKPKACRTRPELGPRRPLAQLPTAGHGRHS